MHLKYVPSNENIADAPSHWLFLVQGGVGPSFKRGLDHRLLTWCLWTATVAEEGIEACCLITGLSRLRILQQLMFSHKRYRWNITPMSFLLSFSWDLCCGTFFINARVFRFYRHCPSFTTASLSVSNTPRFGSRFFSSWEERWSGLYCFSLPAPARISLLQSWTNALGIVLQYSYFSLISRFPLKTVQRLRNFLAVLPAPTLYKVETRKKFWIQASNIVLWGEGRSWTCVTWKTPLKFNAKVSYDFGPWLSEKEVGRKKAILRGNFQACKSVFFGILMKDRNWTNLFPAFRSFLNVI